MCVPYANKYGFLQTKTGKAGCVTCEGGRVDDDLWVKGVGVTKCISQYEPPLGIGVINLQREGSKKLR